jgi:DNA-binding PadR family transcriptional regulator
MGEAVLKLVDPEETGVKALRYAETVSMFPSIKTPQEYVLAGDLWKAGKALIEEINEGYDSIIKKAHELHKDAIARKAKYFVPAESGVKAIKRIMSAYDAEQEAIRQAEQRRLEEIARKEAEEEALLAAIAAEEEAKRNGATKEEAKQEAEAIISQPVYVAPVVLAKETPKVTGLSFRTIWKFKIEREDLLPVEYTKPDEVKIGQVVRALKGQTNIRGVKVYEERC